MRRFATLAVCALAAAIAPGIAAATWSIVAVDAETNELGVAIASCVELPSRYYDDRDVLTLLALVPGTGAGVSQAQINPDAPERIEANLEVGKTAEETIADLTGDFDPDSAQRQHAVVRLDAPDAPAAFTGSETQAWSGHETAPGVSAQGNILVSREVVADSLSAYLAAGDAPLRDRLVQGLLAGSEAGGDHRCAPEQSALFAHVTVMSADGSVTAATTRVERGDDNPVRLLAAGETSGPPDGGFAGLVAAVAVVAVLAGIGVGVVPLVRRSRRRSASS